MELSQLLGALQDKQTQNTQHDMTVLETAFREVALSCGRAALSKYLSEMSEAAPVCPNCGEPMRNLDKRSKTIVTLLGEVEYSRNYYGCCNVERECNEHAIPKDENLGVSGTRFTEAVKRVTAQIAASDSFKDTSSNLKFLCGIDVSAKEAEYIAKDCGAKIIEQQLQEINAAFDIFSSAASKPKAPIQKLYIEYDGTGVPIRKQELAGVKGKQPDGSAKTREIKTGCIFTQSRLDKDENPVRDADSASYFANIGTMNEFSPLLYSEAVKRGVDHAQQVIVIGDGAKWIWSLAQEKFGGATEIIDLYHAKEHVANLVKATISDRVEIERQKKNLFELLENGDIDALVLGFRELPATTDEQHNKIRVECNYFTENRKRMQYPAFRKQGLFVGSGVIEATCKNVIGKRLKQSGMHWSVAGANKIATLRCAVMSGAFETYLQPTALNIHTFAPLDVVDAV